MRGLLQDIRKANTAIIKQVQGSIEHTGKAPEAISEKYKQRKALEKLKQEINDAIIKEDYEQAAILRDRIKAMEKEGV